MPRATWNDAGTRLYHTGVDRGMLYTSLFSVPWNGLVSVTESPDGGDPVPYYLDGRKVLNISASENYKGTIQAFSAPLEFAPCAGRLLLSPALYAADQPKETFGFSYRTLVGNDLAGTDYAYKVHVVYGVTGKMSDFAHETVADKVNPRTYSWDINAVPVPVPGYRPTAHLSFDTRKNSSDVMTALEAILYGDDINDPRMPVVSELVTLLAS